MVISKKINEEKLQLIEKGKKYGLNEKAMNNATTEQLKNIIDKVDKFMKVR